MSGDCTQTVAASIVNQLERGTAAGCPLVPSPLAAQSSLSLPCQPDGSPSR